LSTVRRTAAALSAAALLAACGGGSSGTASKPPTKAEADAAAAAINLTAADIPADYKAAAHTSTTEGDAENTAFVACIGATPPHTDEVTDVYSQEFTKGAAVESTQVSSEVAVVSSAKTANTDAKAFTGSKTKGCIETFVTKLLASTTKDTPGVTFGKPAVTSLDIGKAGLDAAFGYSVAISASAAGQQFPFEVTLIGLLKKHTEVSFTVFSIGPSLAAAERQALVEKLRERIKKSAV
jgi:hypothetical protein